MADQAVELGGVPWKAANPEQAAQMVRSGGNALDMNSALALNQAEADQSYVDQNWGVGGKAAMGLASGLTLGIGPGLLAKLGMVDPAHLQAAQGSGWYTAGDVVGTALPALLSGGESLGARTAVGRALSYTPSGLMNLAGNAAERLGAGVLGETGGLLGRVGTSALQMAARGATEGALMNMGHTIGDNLVTNKPFSAEALAASGMDGALFGALAGGAMGTVAGLGEVAVKAAEGVGKHVAERLPSLQAKALGYGEKEIAEAGTNLKTELSQSYDVLRMGGAGPNSSVSEKYAASKKAYDIALDTKRATLKELQDQFPSQAPDVTRLQKRLEMEVIAPSLQGLDESAVQKAMTKVDAELQKLSPIKTVKVPAADAGDIELGSALEAKTPTVKTQIRQSPTWEGWTKFRDSIANGEIVAAPEIRQKILSVVDSEVRGAVEALSPELAQKLMASEAQMVLSKKLEETLGRKFSNSAMSHEPGVGLKDVGAFVGMSAIGHPVSGLTWLASRAAGRKLQSMVEPWLANLAYNNSIGVKAAGATMDAQSRITNGIRSFFRKTSNSNMKGIQGVYAEKKTQSNQNYDRKAYEKDMSKTEQLLSASHQEKVREYAAELSRQGYTDLATSILDTNQKAVNYAYYNQPARAAGKTLNSLRKVPVDPMPNLQEWKYWRIDKAIKNPFSVLDGLNDGSVSRDAVKAVKYVYPEIHNQMVMAASQEIVESKIRGEYLPMDKITSLGILLDAPIDTILQPDRIAAIQSGFAQKAADQQQQQAPDNGSQPMGLMAQSLMTPVQQTTMG